MLDTFVKEVSNRDNLLNTKGLVSRLKYIAPIKGSTRKQERQIVEAVCGFFGVTIPENKSKNEDLPSPLYRKSASVGRLLSKTVSLSSKLQERLLKKNDDK
jgi:hypothetical protein